MTQSPNIVLILADDMGYGDVSRLNPDANFRTPNMDSLAEKGMLFTDAHSNSAVCTPTRYGLLTGRYCWRTRLKAGVLWGFDGPLVDEERLTLPGMLQRQGYRTSCFGKWHLGLDWSTTDGEPPEEKGENVDYAGRIGGGPVDRGFDYFFGIAGSNNMGPFCFIEDDHVANVPDRPKAPLRPCEVDLPMSADWSDDQLGIRLTEKAQEWLDDHQRNHTDQPFFLYLPSEAPHRPCVPSERFRGKSGAGRRGDMVLEFDWTVGQIRKKIEEMGETENTIFIVTSDNGPRPGDPLQVVENEVDGEPELKSGFVTYGHNPAHIYRGQKADIWDAGHRVPFIVSWPGHVPENSENEYLFSLTDLMATFADLLDCSLPDSAGEDSISFADVWQCNESDHAPRSSMIQHSLSGMFAVRTSRWKLATEQGSGGFTDYTPFPDEPDGQLYDMQKDPCETENLYDKREDVVEELELILQQTQQGNRNE